MSDPDLLPNGMRLGQRVRMFSAAGRQYGVLAEGEVVGWQPSPTVALLNGDGPVRHVIADAPWEPLDEEPENGSVLVRDDGQVSMRVGNSTWTMTPAQWHALVSAPVEEGAS